MKLDGDYVSITLRSHHAVKRRIFHAIPLTRVVPGLLHDSLLTDFE